MPAALAPCRAPPHPGQACAALPTPLAGPRFSPCTEQGGAPAAARAAPTVRRRSTVDADAAHTPAIFLPSIKHTVVHTPVSRPPTHHLHPAPPAVHYPRRPSGRPPRAPLSTPLHCLCGRPLACALHSTLQQSCLKCLNQPGLVLGGRCCCSPNAVGPGCCKCCTAGARHEPKRSEQGGNHWQPGRCLSFSSCRPATSRQCMDNRMNDRGLPSE